MSIPPFQSSDTSLPQWAINALVWVVVGVWGLIIAVLGWFTRKYIIKVDAHADLLGTIPATYATIQMVKEMEDKIPDLVTRVELVAYMRQMKEDSDVRHAEHVKTQLRMHSENIAAAVETRAAINAVGSETRTSIGAVHARVDALFSK